MPSHEKNILESLKFLRDTWSNYFFDYSHCQSFIKFNEEVATNYLPDILYNLEDTFRLIIDIDYSDDNEKSLFQAIAVLQIIYTHQDLIDETLNIYSLSKSVKEDKNPNREVRNQLISHPISRLKGKLNSSVFYGRNFNNGLVEYIIYSRENNFKGEIKHFELKEMIKNHYIYLEKYIEQIKTKHVTLCFPLEICC